MKNRILALTALVLAFPLRAQHVANPHASLIDIPARRAFPQSALDPRLRDAVAHLQSCVAMPSVAAPADPMVIPHHYLVGSSGPTNPAEREATRVYSAFEERITAGMNQYVATGSEPEAQCALAQIDAWAQAKALLNYDPADRANTQSWYQAEWTLCSTGITFSVLVDDPHLDAATVARITAWLNGAAHRLISFEKPGELGNNHHYWRALAATSIGIVSNDDKLFRFGVDTYKQAIGQLDSNGAFPLEMARHENATHYQAFALQPLVIIAEFAARQNVDLYSVSEHQRTIKDAIVFLGRAIADPTLIRQYTNDPQHSAFGSGDVAELNFYIARFGAAGLPTSLTGLLARPATATRIGGSTTVLAARE
jgi:poly(beta-D-mannuronate) lyase